MKLDWNAVEEAARSLGVSAAALKKWRWRKSVPHKWRLAIIRKSGGRISLDAFERSVTRSRDAAE